MDAGRRGLPLPRGEEQGQTAISGETAEVMVVEDVRDRKVEVPRQTADVLKRK